MKYIFVCISDFDMVFRYLRKKPEVTIIIIKWNVLNAKSKYYKLRPIWKLQTPNIDIPIKSARYKIEVDKTIITKLAIWSYRCYFIQANLINFILTFQRISNFYHIIKRENNIVKKLS